MIKINHKGLKKEKGIKELKGEKRVKGKKRVIKRRDKNGRRKESWALLVYCAAPRRSEAGGMGTGKRARYRHKKRDPGTDSRVSLGGDYLLSHFRSTIGVVRLNFSVRNGKRWDPHAITTLMTSAMNNEQ